MTDLRQEKTINHNDAEHIYIRHLQAKDIVTCNVSLRVYNDDTSESKSFIIGPKTVIIVIHEETDIRTTHQKIFKILVEGQLGLLYLSTKNSDIMFTVVTRL